VDDLRQLQLFYQASRYGNAASILVPIPAHESELARSVRLAQHIGVEALAVNRKQAARLAV